MISLLVISCCLFTVQAEWKFSTIDISVSDSCKAAIQRLSELDVSDPQLTAYYWDSWGKPSDGILTGDTIFLGHYDECINLKNTALGGMKYCLYSMIMETNTSLTTPAKGVCSSNECPVPINISSATDIKVGICYPSQCSSTEFSTVLSTIVITNIAKITSPNKINTYATTIKSTGHSPVFCPDTDVELDTGAVVVIIICGLLIGLVIVGTAADYVSQILSPPSDVINNAQTAVDKEETVDSSEKPKHIGKQVTMKDFMLAFSLYNTVSSLVSTKQSPSTIKGLNAMKILCNSLIVMHHIDVFATVMFPSAGVITYFLTVLSRIVFQPVINVTFAVDAFFLISATLSAYLTFRDMDKHKKFRCGYFYLNRIMRLSPMYYLFTFIAYKLSVHFGQGPLWYSHDYHTCTSTWWYNIFYLNNLLESSSSCVLATWHICADLQLFILSPIFIVLLHHSPYRGIIAIATAMVMATTTIGILSAKNGYFAAIYANPKAAEQIYGLHLNPFHRVNSYLTGIVLGYILYKRYNIATLPIRNWLKQLIYLALWSIAIYLCTVPTLFGTYGEYSQTHHFTDFENITFLMFSGLAFSIGLSIIIYICNTGYGGMFGSFISWPGWDPMSRLIYSVFLIHQMVIFYIFGMLQSKLRYTDTVYIMISVFTIVASYILSVFTAVFGELPMANVVSLCFKLAGMEARSKPLAAKKSFD